jgi:hypothetical protein
MLFITNNHPIVINNDIHLKICISVHVNNNLSRCVIEVIYYMFIAMVWYGAVIHYTTTPVCPAIQEPCAHSAQVCVHISCQCVQDDVVLSRSEQ